ncbi:MAG: hypothetical protein ACXW03_01635 [Methylobacter sp.]
MLGGTIDWAGLPVVVEILGIDDVELLVKQLLLIQQFQSQE